MSFLKRRRALLTEGKDQADHTTNFLLSWDADVVNFCCIGLPNFGMSQTRDQECRGTSARQPLNAGGQSLIKFYAYFISF